MKQHNKIWIYRYNEKEKTRERERERERENKVSGIYQNIQTPKIVRAFNLKANKVEIVQKLLS